MDIGSATNVLFARLSASIFFEQYPANSSKAKIL